MGVACTIEVKKIHINRLWVPSRGNSNMTGNVVVAMLTFMSLRPSLCASVGVYVYLYTCVCQCVFVRARARACVCVVWCVVCVVWCVVAAVLQLAKDTNHDCNIVAHAAPDGEPIPGLLPCPLRGRGGGAILPA